MSAYRYVLMLGLLGSTTCPEEPDTPTPIPSPTPTEGGTPIPSPTPTEDATPSPPSDPDCDVFPELARHEARFTEQVYPLMTRDEGGCTECHAQGSSRMMTMGTTGSDTFYRLRADGFLDGDGPGTMLGKVSLTGPASMPLGGPHWTDEEIDRLRCVVEALMSYEAGDVIPPDEAFPDYLLEPYSGPAPTSYDNTWLSWRQLKGRVAVQFEDDWVRDGVDLFDQNIQFFGGVNFETSFVPNRQPTADYLLGMDLLSRDVCGLAASQGTGPFTGLDLDAPVLEEPPSETIYLDVPELDPPTAGSTWTSDGDEIGLIWSHGYMGATIDFPIDGTYRLTAWADGDEAGLDLPEMALSVDGQFVAYFDVPESGVFTPFSADVPIFGGEHYVAVHFTNDYYNEATGQDRNLYITGLEWEGPEAGSTGGAVGARDATLARIDTLVETLLYRPAIFVPGGGATIVDDESMALYELLLDLIELDGDRHGAWAGVCELLLKHPDFLFTRPPYFDTASAAERESLLFLRTALDLVDRPPTDLEWARFEDGESREAFIAEWLASEDFLESYFYRSRLLLESSGTAVSDEPARIFTYIFQEEQPVGELLTGDYTVNEAFEAVSRPAYHGPTGLLTTEGYIIDKPGLPHYNYAARVLQDFMGYVFEVPPEIVDTRAGTTAASTVDPESVCFSCHQLLTPLAHQRLRWDDEGNYREVDDEGEPIDDSDRGMVEGYPFAGDGMAAFGAQAVRKERFTRRMANTQFEMLMNRPIRVDEDERDLYYDLFYGADQGEGSLRELMEIILTSESYTNPVGSRGEGEQ